jgi:hypothetical protein
MLLRKATNEGSKSLKKLMTEVKYEIFNNNNSFIRIGLCNV